MNRRDLRWRLMCLGAAALLLTACSTSASPGASSSSSTAPSGAKHYNIALIVGVTNNPFYTSMEKGAMAAAAELGVTLSIDGAPTWDASKQVPILNAVIARHPDGIVFVPNDPGAENTALQAAIDAGIVVATADTDVSDPALRIINYASDNLEGGKMAGDALMQQIGNKGKVFLLNAIPGLTDSLARQQGFEQAIKPYVDSGAVEYLPVQFSQEDQQKGTAIIAAVLQAHPDLAGIFAEDTINGQAAVTAVQNANLAGKVKVVAFDAGPTEVEALKAGTISALIAQKPYDEGADAVKAIVDYLNGNKSAYTGAVVHPGYVVMTPENISDPNVAKYAYPLNLND